MTKPRTITEFDRARTKVMDDKAVHLLGEAAWQVIKDIYAERLWKLGRVLEAAEEYLNKRDPDSMRLLGVAIEEARALPKEVEDNGRDPEDVG